MTDRAFPEDPLLPFHVQESEMEPRWKKSKKMTRKRSWHKQRSAEQPRWKSMFSHVNSESVGRALDGKKGIQEHTATKKAQVSLRHFWLEFYWTTIVSGLTYHNNLPHILSLTLLRLTWFIVDSFSVWKWRQRDCARESRSSWKCKST